MGRINVGHGSVTTLLLSLILFLVPMTPCDTIYLVLAESQLIGGHTEYLVLCGLDVPSLRLLWGAIWNRQLYILCRYYKSCILFKFSIFFK